MTTMIVSSNKTIDDPLNFTHLTLLEASRKRKRARATIICSHAHICTHWYEAYELKKLLRKNPPGIGKNDDDDDYDDDDDADDDDD
eukprot:8635773-Karenia_brevis.AAC.1